MNKYDSTSLKCLFLSTSPIASSRVCCVGACIIALSMINSQLSSLFSSVR